MSPLIPSSVPRVWNAALYVRLSKEDGNDVSLSVRHQRQRLADYLLAHPQEFCLYEVYVDDGFTGTDTNRTAFLQMLADIRAKRVDCVIVKDPSRLSRNYIEAGHYMERLFVELDVRFISLELPALDSYRAPELMNSILVPLQNVINDDFCRQTSFKVRSVLMSKRKNGEFIGAFAPYGYQKDPSDRHRLLIDPEAAGVVRYIFRWFTIEGMSKAGIAKRLNAMRIPNPAAYKRAQGLPYHNPNALQNDGLWSAGTVAKILANPTYLGHTVQGRSRVKSYKVHTEVRVPPEEWVWAKHTHAPIISEAAFAQVQAQNALRAKTAPNKASLSPFAGLVRCANCGKAMTRRSAKGHIYYACRTYREKSVQACTGHTIRLDTLEAAVSGALRTLIAVGWGGTTPDTQEAQIRKRTEKQERRLLYEREKIQHALTNLYIDWKVGELSKEEYVRMKDAFSQRIAAIDAAREQLLHAQEAERAAREARARFFRMPLHPGGTLPDRGLLCTFLEIVYIHQSGAITLVFRCANPCGSGTESL